MTWITVATAAMQAGSTIYGAVTAGNNKAKPINISGVIDAARTQAKDDLQNSLNLEQQYLPGQYANMMGSFGLTNSILSGNTQAQQVQGRLLDQAGTSLVNPGAAVNNPLTSASNASILQSLNMGGSLDASTQAQVMQNALQGAGTAGISGSGAGRGLVARDLGLTSLQLLQSRQNQASQAGNAYAALALQGQGLQLQDYLSRMGVAQGAVNAQNQYSLGLGGQMNNLVLPNSGLSPSQVASLMVGNTNIMNQANQQSSANNASAATGTAGTLTSLLGSKDVMSGLAKLFGSSVSTSD